MSASRWLGAAIAWRRRWFGSGWNPVVEGYRPYADEACNLLYNQSFCDKPAAFRRTASAESTESSVVLAEQPDVEALRALANDPQAASRVRALAFGRLRTLGQAVPPRLLLGTVVELGLPGGLDVLAAYPDGCVWYLNHKELIAQFDPVPSGWMPAVRRLLAASQGAVERIGPWLQPRIAPPTEGTVRMSFVVSDGLYFGQGPMAVMERDEMAKPIIAASIALLQSVNAAKH